MSNSAKDIFEEKFVLKLSLRDVLRLQELMENPPPRNQKFLEAQAHYLETVKDNIPPYVRVT